MRHTLFRLRLVDEDGRLEIANVLAILFAADALLEPSVHSLIALGIAFALKTVEHLWPSKTAPKPIVDEFSAYKKKVDELASNLRAVNLRVGLGR